MKRLAFYLLPLLLLAGCSTKVGNPDNDDDQDEVQDPIVLKPIDLRLQSFPDIEAMSIDESLKGLLRDTFALTEVSNAMLGQLNELFVLINEQKLTRSGNVTLAKDGLVLTGRSWRTGELNGLYFCNDAERVFYFTWQGDDLHVVRDLKQAAPVSKHPMTDGLPAMIDATIDNEKAGLAVAYSGIRRDPRTKQDTTTRIAFHYDAVRPTPDATDYSGLYAETDAAIKIPEIIDRRIVGRITAEGGEALAHLDGLCAPFDEAVAGQPSWCVVLKHTAATVDVGLADAVPAAYERLKTLPVPKRANLRKVEFPADMTCPVQ